MGQRPKIGARSPIYSNASGRGAENFLSHLHNPGLCAASPSPLLDINNYYGKYYMHCVARARDLYGQTRGSAYVQMTKLALPAAQVDHLVSK